MSKGGKTAFDAALFRPPCACRSDPPTTAAAARRWRVLILALVAIWCGVGIAAVLAFFAADLPSTEGLWRQERTHAVTLLDVNGRVIARRGINSGLPVTLKDLPAFVPQAVLASEDRRFYSHFGLDFWGLGRAAWVNMNAGRVVQGGSTITQQLAKNLFLKPERTLPRKFKKRCSPSIWRCRSRRTRFWRSISIGFISARVPMGSMRRRGGISTSRRRG